MTDVCADAVECGEAVVDSRDEPGESGGDGMLSGGIDAGDVVEKGEDVLNESAEIAKECRDG